MKRILLILSVFVLLLSSCEKEEKVVYGLKSTDILTPSANKDKLKSDEQFIAVLYVNLFQQAISSSEQIEVEHLIRSFGDKRLAYEILISNYMNRPDVIIPTNAEMRQNIDQFIIDTYEKFYVRIPTQLEMAYFKNYLENNENISPELVYFSFAISDESFYY